VTGGKPERTQPNSKVVKGVFWWVVDQSVWVRVIAKCNKPPELGVNGYPERKSGI